MQIGTRVAHYEVISTIGRGGMGEVYKARDSKLKRDVALKTLSEELAADPDRMERLEREAQIIAALNHPHIAAIHGIEEIDGRKVLVLELVEGQTLADRLRGGPLRVDIAFEIALQIASAIENAHDRGVAHRDLKPDNVAFTRDGHVKVLDFGLARDLASAGSAHATLVNVERGVASGTAAYMSPEQARGETTDGQTDIWAFGITLYEMLTGTSPFERKSSTETLARVLEAEPDYNKLPPSLPAGAKRLVRRCLEKDRRRRFRHMADVRIEIEDTLTALSTEPAAVPVRRAHGRAFVAAAAAAIVLFAVTAIALRSWMLGGDGAPPEVVRLAIPGVERPFPLPFGTQDLAISADGAQVAYTGRDGTAVRRLRDSQATKLSLTGANPVFSPDGTWLAAGTLRRAPISGGAPTELVVNTERPAGTTWSRDGTIIFATTGGLYRVDAAGGEPEVLLRPSSERGEVLFAWPHFLPNGSAVVFTIVPRGAIEGAQIAWLDLTTHETRVLVTGGTSPRYTPTGHIVYASEQRLKAIAFDADAGTANGEPVEIPGIAVVTRPDNGAALFAIADDGTLAFVEPETVQTTGRRNIAWIDRDGTEQLLPIEPSRYGYVRASPDGSRIAVDIFGATNRDIWVWDIARESLTRLTDGANEDMLPVWSRDGQRIYFTSERNGNFDIFSQAADGSTAARPLFEDPRFHAPHAFSADGTKLFLNQEFRDLAVFDLGQSKLDTLLQSSAREWLSELSPDGRWYLYDSDESGRFEVWLRPFPDLEGARVQVSSAGGGYPKWGPPGSNELYYIAADGAMMAATVENGPPVRVSRPTKLFQFAPQIELGAGGLPYDVVRDGRFITTRVANDAPSQPVTVNVILNWFEDLRALAPIAR
jgi:serine/threonine-protein kinase